VRLGLILFSLAGCQGSQTRALELAAQAEAQLQAGQVAAARQSIDQAIAERDDIAPLYVEKARIALAQNLTAEAFTAYSNASALDTTNMEALQGIAQLGLAVGRLEEADAAADRILVVLPSEPNALFTKGMIKLSTRQGDAAMRFADNIVSASPRDPRGLILKARTLFFLGKTQEALSVLDQGTAGTTPEEAVTATYLELHREQSNAAAMLTDFAALAKARKDDPPRRLDEANLRYKINDMEGARRLVGGLLRSPTITPAVLMRIVAIWKQYDQDPISLGDAQKSAVFGTPLARIETARYYLDLGKPSKTNDLLAGDKSADAEALRARAILATRPDAPLQDAVRAILAADPTQCDAMLARAELALVRNDIPRAIADAQQVIAECPGNAGGYRVLAKIHRVTKDKNAEFRAYDLALANTPQDVLIAQEYYARALALGDEKRAQATARQITRSVPSWSPGWEMLASACARAGNQSCRADSARRAALARTAYTLDPLPGETTFRGLLGRLQR
jgi:predicted Zn-dependent protease